MSAKHSHGLAMWKRANTPPDLTPGRVMDLPPSLGPIDPHVAFSAVNRARDYRDQGFIEDADGRIRIYDEKLDAYVLWNTTREEDLVERFAAMHVPTLEQLKQALERDVDFVSLFWSKWQDGDFDAFQDTYQARTMYINRIMLKIIRCSR